MAGLKEQKKEKKKEVLSISNNFYGHRRITSSIQECRLLLQNTCERMCHSQELGDFQCGTVIGCHLCNKSSHEMSSILNIPQSAVSCIIKKCKSLHFSATWPQSDRPHKITEWGQQLRRTVHRGCQFSTVSCYRPPNFMLPSDQLMNSVQKASWNWFPIPWLSS